MSSYREAPYSRRDGNYGRDREEPRHTLYLRGFAPDTTEEEALAFLRRFGEIQRTHSQLEKKHTMFVTYCDLRCATKALQEIPSQRLKGARLEAHYALPKNRPTEEEENQGTVFVALDGARNGTIDTAELRALVEGWGVDVREVRSARGSQARFVECWDLRHSAKLVQEHQNQPYRGGRLKFKYALPKPRADDDRYGPGPVRGSYSDRDRDRERDYAMRSSSLALPASAPLPLQLPQLQLPLTSAQPALDLTAITALLNPTQTLPLQYTPLQHAQQPLLQQLQQQLQSQQSLQPQPHTLQPQQQLQQLLASSQTSPLNSALLSALTAQQPPQPQIVTQPLQLQPQPQQQLQQPSLLFLNPAQQQQQPQQQASLPQQPAVASGNSSGSVGAAGSTVQQLAALLQLQHQLAQSHAAALPVNAAQQQQPNPPGSAAAPPAPRFGGY